MPTKTRVWRQLAITGRQREYPYTTWVPYSSTTPTSFETSIGVNNHWNGHCWEGGSGWRLTRDAHTFEPQISKEFDGYNATKSLVTDEGTTRIGGPKIGIVSLSIPTRSSDEQLDAYGTTAISRTEPTAPAFDLAVSLGELMREGIPVAPGSQVRDKVKLARASGGEYLNLEFGWLPLVRSIEDFSSVVRKSDDILRSYQEKANKPIKRSYEWPTYSTSKYTPCAFSTLSPSRGDFQGGGRFQTVMQRRWFEASYLYHLPVGNEHNDKFRRYAAYARKLYGIDATPEVLWNLAPWSWAVDWFSNAGDVIHNVSAMGQDGMVIRYAHIMEHTVRVTKDHGTHSGGGGPMLHTQVEEWKTRRSATPFGFGVSWSGLSPKQIAIVSALGLTRF